MRGPTVIKWQDPELINEVMRSYKNLINAKWIRPPVRTLLYQLIGDYKGKWEKKHYDRLTTWLQELRDRGELEYGLFSYDSGGADSIPPTEAKKREQIEAWKRTNTIQLSRDGNLYVLFHEHAGTIPTLAQLFDYKLSIVSSQGQIKHEHLYKIFKDEVISAFHALNGKRVKVIGIADYDIYGAKDINDGKGHILRAHKEWLERTFREVDFILYGVTREQVIEAGLDPEDEHQYDGWLKNYTLDRFKKDILELANMEDD